MKYNKLLKRWGSHCKMACCLFVADFSLMIVTNTSPLPNYFSCVHVWRAHVWVYMYVCSHKRSIPVTHALVNYYNGAGVGLILIGRTMHVQAL